MRTLYWWLFIAVRRWICGQLGHRDGVQIKHGHAVTRCTRCWRAEIERLPEMAP